MTNPTCTASISGHAPQTVSGVPGALVGFIAKEIRSWPSGILRTLVVWQRRWESRTRLAEMESHRLRDAGLTRIHIRTETQKPFWTA